MKQAYFKYLSALLLFGSNGIVASFISLSSYEIVFLRTLIGGAFILIVFVLTKQKLNCFRNKKHMASILVSGVAMGVSWLFLFEAYTRIGVSLATLAYYCGPGIVIALSQLLFHESITSARIFGFISIVTGLFLVNGSDLISSGLSWGLLCGMLSAVAYAVMIIFNKKATSIIGLENAMLQLVISFFVVTIFTLSRQGIADLPILENFIPILIFGVVNTGIGCYLYFSSIQKLPAGTVAICGYLDPLSALGFSALFLHERLTTIQIIGAALILGGAIAGEYLHKKKFDCF